MGVVFSQVPSYYSSVFEPLIYKIDNIGTGVCADVEIYVSGKNEPVGVKRLRGGGSSEVNISCYMRRGLSPSPFASDSVGLFSDPGRCITAGVECMGVMSPIRTYVGSCRAISEFEVLSSLPLRRSISWEESDEISLLVPNSSLTYDLSLSGTKSYVFRSPEYIASRGVVTMGVGMPGIRALVLNAGMKPEEFAKMKIRIMNVKDVVAQVEYDICSRYAGDVRLCWYNRLGALDYHTFSVAVYDAVSVEKDMVLGSDGYVPAYISRNQYTELSSGYLPHIWIEGLSHLLSSPKVWRSDEFSFVPVDILSSGIRICNRQINSLAFAVRNKIPLTCQNF